MLYITYDNFNRPNFAGIKKKVYSHLDVFERYLGEVYFTRYEYGVLYYCKDDCVLEKKSVISPREMFDSILGWITKYNHTQIYFRFRFPINCWVIDFIRELTIRNLRFIFEIPTFPYEDLIKNPRVLKEDILYRKCLKDLSPIVTTYSSIGEAYGIPLITLKNGVEPKSFMLRKAKQKDSVIVLLAVSSMSTVLGVERVLLGLKNYYQNSNKYDFKLRLVGQGRENSYYKSLVRKYELEEHVEFYGFCVGEELNEMYAKADIGVGNLGHYKAGINSASPLKISEYYACGLPFVYGYDDDSLTGNEDYLLKVSNDNEPINMMEVIKLYEKTVGDQEIINKMREKAERVFSWDAIMQGIIRYLKGEISRQELFEYYERN